MVREFGGNGHLLSSISVYWRSFAVSFSSGFSVPTDRRFIDVDVHLFGFEILIDAVEAKFTPDTALLIPTPGKLVESRMIGVHPDDTGADLLRDASRSMNVPRPDSGRQTIFGIVGDFDGLLLRIK